MATPPLNLPSHPFTRAIRALFGKSSDRTHRLPVVVAAGETPAEVARIEVEVSRPRAV